MLMGIGVLLIGISMFAIAVSCVVLTGFTVRMFEFYDKVIMKPGIDYLNKKA